MQDAMKQAREQRERVTPEPARSPRRGRPAQPRDRCQRRQARRGLEEHLRPRCAEGGVSELSLTELLADGAIRASLSSTEVTILRAAGRGSTSESIARTYGCSPEQVDRIIADIRTRVSAATGGSVSPSVPTARRASSTVHTGADEILALLAEGQCSSASIVTRVAMPRASAYAVIGELKRAGKIHKVGKDGRSSIYSLTKAPLSAAPAAPASAASQQDADWVSLFVDVEKLDGTIEDLEARISEIGALKADCKRLRYLRSAIRTFGV